MDANPQWMHILVKNVDRLFKWVNCPCMALTGWWSQRLGLGLELNIFDGIDVGRYDNFFELFVIHF